MEVEYPGLIMQLLQMEVLSISIRPLLPATSSTVMELSQFGRLVYSNQGIVMVRTEVDRIGLPVTAETIKEFSLLISKCGDHYPL